MTKSSPASSLRFDSNLKEQTATLKEKGKERFNLLIKTKKNQLTFKIEFFIFNIDNKEYERKVAARH